MNKKILNHIKFIEDKLESSKNIKELEDVNEYNILSTKHFQAERVVHLLVTLFFSLFSLLLLSVYLITQRNILMIPCILSLILLIPYIFHYYSLENGVQSLYKLDKKIFDKISQLKTGVE